MIGTDEKNKFGKMAFIGERELAIGFRLVGVAETFIENRESFPEKLKALYYSNNFDLILASNTFIKTVDKKFLNTLQSSVSPLVVFVPVSTTTEEEGISGLARRVLGIKLDLGEM